MKVVYEDWSMSRGCTAKRSTMTPKLVSFQRKVR